MRAEKHAQIRHFPQTALTYFYPYRRKDTPQTHSTQFQSAQSGMKLRGDRCWGGGRAFTGCPRWAARLPAGCGGSQGRLLAARQPGRPPCGQPGSIPAAGGPIPKALKKIPNASSPNAYIFRHLIPTAEIYLQWKRLNTKELSRKSCG